MSIEGVNPINSQKIETSQLQKAEREENVSIFGENKTETEENNNIYAEIAENKSPYEVLSDYPESKSEFTDAYKAERKLAIIKYLNAGFNEGVEAGEFEKDNKLDKTTYFTFVEEKYKEAKQNYIEQFNKEHKNPTIEEKQKHELKLACFDLDIEEIHKKMRYENPSQLSKILAGAEKIAQGSISHAINSRLDKLINPDKYRDKVVNNDNSVDVENMTIHSTEINNNSSATTINNNYGDGGFSSETYRTDYHSSDRNETWITERG